MEIMKLMNYFQFFANLDGEFQIDTAVYKIAGNKLIIVLRPSLVDIGAIDEETEPDTSTGIRVQEIVTLASGGCCDFSGKDTEVYQTTPSRRRVWVDYVIWGANIEAPNPLDPFGSLLVPVISLDSRGKSQIRRGFFIHWWTRLERDLQYNIDVEIQHDLPIQWNMPNPVIFTHNESPEDEWRVSELLVEGGNLAQVRPLGVPNWAISCIMEEDVRLRITDLFNLPTASLICL